MFSARSNSLAGNNNRLKLAFSGTQTRARYSNSAMAPLSKPSTFFCPLGIERVLLTAQRSAASIILLLPTTKPALGEPAPAPRR